MGEAVRFDLAIFEELQVLFPEISDHLAGVSISLGYYVVDDE